VIVAKLTGWGLGDLLALSVDELIEWHRAADKVEKEIAAQLKKR
jgi:hypothetical protein